MVRADPEVMPNAVFDPAARVFVNHWYWAAAAIVPAFVTSDGTDVVAVTLIAAHKYP